MWDDLLDTCIYAYNTSVHESTSFTPFEVMFGRKAVLPIDVEMNIASPYINDEAEPLGSVIERLSEQRLKTLTMVKECIHRAQKKQKDVYDRKHALSNSYVIGDLVFKKDFKRKKRAGGKLDSQYVGPYIITEVHGKGTYRLLLMENKECIVERVSGTHFKPYIAVQSDDEKDATKKREMIAQKPLFNWNVK